MTDTTKHEAAADLVEKHGGQVWREHRDPAVTIDLSKIAALIDRVRTVERRACELATVSALYKADQDSNVIKVASDAIRARNGITTLSTSSPAGSPRISRTKPN